MEPKDFIVFEDAAFTYDGSTYVFRHLDLSIPAGQFLCLLGGNGSGKSTLAKCMNGLLLPDAGRVLTFGRNTADADSLYYIRSNAGLVFQNTGDQLVASLVENDVAFGPENLGVPMPELAKRVEEALASVGLQGFQLHETSALSGGQKQRVAIAGILAMDPAILILDEASAMLDPRGRAGLLRVCQELHDGGMTIIMITHFMEEAACAERVVILDEGRISLDGPPEEMLIHTEALRKRSLDVPFAASLSLGLRTRGIDVSPCIQERELVQELEQQKRARDAQPIRADLRESISGSIHCSGAIEVMEEEASALADELLPPLLEFQDVSFSYSDPKRKEKRRSLKRTKEQSCTSSALAETKADWGPDPEAIWALRHIDLAIHEGEFLGIAGHTGSGKSTLIQQMNGLLLPTEGRVLFRGRSLEDKATATEARTAVGLVFQYPEYQLFAATVFDDVAFGPRNQGHGPDEVRRRVHAALESVGLSFEALSSKSPFELSGGQQRRVALAGVLAMEPAILVLDEPAAGLDPQGRKEFLALIERLHRDGLTCVMVSHSMDDLARMADRIYVLNEGRTFADDIPAAVFADADGLHRIGLGVPAAQHMALQLRHVGWPLDRPLYDERTLAEDVVRILAPKAARGSERGGRHE